MGACCCRWRSGVRRLALSLAIASALLWPESAAAQPGRFALIVSGASGGTEYAEQYAAWSGDLTALLTGRLALDPAAITVLSEGGAGRSTATADNVRLAFEALRKRMTSNDLLFVFLIGHGTFDGTDAKFNLVGLDLEAAEWASLLAATPGRSVVVNTTSASFPFVERLAGPRRVVIAATDSDAQRFDTVFAGFFIQALQDDAADLDKNRRVSIWEAFAAATAEVRLHYQRRGQLSTERALLDDTGDGVGREAGGQGDDGSVASTTYLDAAPPDAAPTDPVLLEWLQKRAAVERDLSDLNIRRRFLQPDEYQREFERLMIALARINREVRARIKS